MFMTLKKKVKSITSLVLSPDDDKFSLSSSNSSLFQQNSNRNSPTPSGSASPVKRHAPPAPQPPPSGSTGRPLSPQSSSGMAGYGGADRAQLMADIRKSPQLARVDRSQVRDRSSPVFGTSSNTNNTTSSIYSSRQTTSSQMAQSRTVIANTPSPVSSRPGSRFSETSNTSTKYDLPSANNTRPTTPWSPTPTFSPDSGRASPRTYVRDDPDAARQSPPTFVRDDPDAARKRLGSPTLNRNRALSPSRANYLPVVGRGLFPKEIEQETIVQASGRPVSRETQRREFYGMNNVSSSVQGRYGVQAKPTPNPAAPKVPMQKTVNWAPTAASGRTSTASQSFAGANKVAIDARSRSRNRDNFQTTTSYQTRGSSRNAHDDYDKRYSRSTSVPARKDGVVHTKTQEWMSDNELSDEALDELFSDVCSQLDELKQPTSTPGSKTVARYDASEQGSQTPFEVAVRDAFNDITKNSSDGAREIEISTREIHRKVTITTTPKTERKFPLTDATVSKQTIQPINSSSSAGKQGGRVGTAVAGGRIMNPGTSVAQAQNGNTKVAFRQTQIQYQRNA